ncbi:MULTISPECIES: TetR/AcrR family transcriptional regulator [Aeromonas]|uniref:TetR family transcriptional regulator n=1 Tax=Aeromonas caviae TaxID=648 RepID=A0AA37CXF1_AERCA|nr:MULTISPECIES: TetR/AcrR family transcriptional regulator [Aeromonas]MEB6608590.1 TetR family transcriptional regulator [Aeromonas sanarellii]GJA18781.1 TetR family transcriptional regulator [Aeromonas caviae]GJA27439.1 TetR family transcriptional regulator [Aeromonas caviae]GJA63063.1 TetR family transcriptional regulator [Aeromonas caviae]GJA73922.1 TetR family transcriptional regulator [Aeromonas caviae]
MSKIDTKNRILDAAEVLFAERGFADTSLRLITSEADVNLASVNYHFGSKKELIQAVLDRYLSLFMPELEARLQTLMAQEQLTLLQVFESFVDPLMKLVAVRPNGPALFMQLLGRGYIDSQGHLRRFITTHYGATLHGITQAISKANPDLSPADLFWRLHFTLGTVVFTMASADALRDIAQADFGQQLDVEGLVRNVIPYLASGVGAPVESTRLSLAV